MGTLLIFALVRLSGRRHLLGTENNRLIQSVLLGTFSVLLGIFEENKYPVYVFSSGCPSFQNICDKGRNVGTSLSYGDISSFALSHLTVNRWETSRFINYFHNYINVFSFLCYKHFNDV